MEQLLTLETTFVLPVLIFIVTSGTSFIKAAFPKIPPRLIAYVLAALLLAGQTAIHSTQWEEWLLVPINALIVALGSYGCYAVCSRKQKEVKNNELEE